MVGSITCADRELRCRPVTRRSVLSLGPLLCACLIRGRAGGASGPARPCVQGSVIGSLSTSDCGLLMVHPPSMMSDWPQRCMWSRAGGAIAGVNKTINYVPPSGSLNRFGQAMNWFFVGMLILSGAVYFANGVRYDTTSAGAPPPVAASTLRCHAQG